MRTMKCRVWDGETLRSLPTMIVDDFSIGFTTEDEFYVDINNHHPTPGLIVTWWTGLKDKNGKEIYEGDIVHTTDGWGNENTCTVVWGDVDNDNPAVYPAFDLEPRIDEELNSFAYAYESGDVSVEVIGNIYSNPELSEGKDAQ